MHPTRRTVLAAAATLPLATRLPAAPNPAATRLAEIERASGGRLGVVIHDLHTGRRIARRADERFPMCSTFKTLAAAFILHRAERGRESLDRQLPVARGAIVPNSPVTEAHVGRSMSIAALCEATITRSDNSAANLLLETFGGPAGLTAFLRASGDRVTRLDRNETDLGTAIPGDPRDTTSPAAILDSYRRFVLGNVLSPASRDRLRGWLIANKTGDNRLRKGVPPGFTIGDKTGGGGYNTNNDVAILWRAGRKPILIAAFLTQGPDDTAARDAVIADVGRCVSFLI